MNNMEKKTLTKKQMENVRGGTTPTIYSYTGTPHCKACGGDAKPFGSLYRCNTPGCSEFGVNKNANEVDWS